MSKAEIAKINDILMAPERRKWEMQHDTLNALKEIATIQSEQAKMLSHLVKDTEQNSQTQNQVNRVLIWLTGSGLFIAVLSLLASVAAVAVALGLLHPLHP